MIPPPCWMIVVRYGGLFLLIELSVRLLSLYIRPFIDIVLESQQSLWCGIYPLRRIIIAIDIVVLVDWDLALEAGDFISN